VLKEPGSILLVVFFNFNIETLSLEYTIPDSKQGKSVTFGEV
jgi:hypothetical protein